jgi:hypothetical protein
MKFCFTLRTIIQIIFVGGLLGAFGCSTPPSFVSKQNSTTTPRPSQLAVSQSPTSIVTLTPWPTIIIPDTPPPQATASPVPFRPYPTDVPTATRVLPTPTKTLPVICYLGGTSLVPIGNYLGPAEFRAELMIGGWQCDIPANTKGYLQMDTGKYDWSARIPARGQLGRVGGNITVATSGLNAAEIVLCIVENKLATIPACPSSGIPSAPQPTSPAPIQPTIPPTRSPK